MKIQSGQTLLMIGDSITDVGRDRPVGEKQGIGSGYVRDVWAQLGANHPDCKISVLNTGISGNRVTDLEARWQEDVLDHSPDWVSVMIGINDVWRHFDSPMIDQVDIEMYELKLDGLIQKTLPAVKGMILMTPYFLETNLSDPMRKQMDMYGAVVKKLSKKHNTVFVDTQAAFDAYLDFQPTQTLCGDRVHPNEVGHMILANVFLKAIEE
mgnify:CR=1 FL=1